MEYSLGALRRPAAQEVERHLQACPGCAEAVREIGRRRGRLDSLLRQFVRGSEPSPGFPRRLFAALEDPPASGAGFWVRAGVLGAAAALVLVSILLSPPARFRKGPGEPSPGAVPALSEWRSPTDWLLASVGDGLLQAGPRLGDFYFPIGPVKTEESARNGGKDAN